MLLKRFSIPCALALISTSLWSQGPGLDSPGQSRYTKLGQTTRFSSDFNPALGFALDGFLDYLDTDGGEDGFDISMRHFELNAAAFIDPNAWAYVVLATEDLGSPEIEEAAVQYTGLEGNTTLRAGRFFVDFGKQMQVHLEELRTLERPLVLREYLGEELGGTGLQIDHWFAAGDATPVRFSIGAFAALLGEGHEEEEEEEEEPEAVVPDRKDIDELSITARLTGMTDVGESGVFQLGASLRYVPEFSFEDDGSGLEADELSNMVYGVDATYGWTGDTGLESFALGGEFLVIDGDLSASVDDPVSPTALNVVDDSATGFFLFGDYNWNLQSSVGAQFSMADLPEDPNEDASEFDVYYTHHLTEFRRVRFGVTLGDVAGEDFVRGYVQFTNFFGSHAHGVNW